MRYSIDKDMSFAVGALVGKATVNIRYVLGDLQDPGQLVIVAVSIVDGSNISAAPWLEPHVMADAGLLSEMVSHASTNPPVQSFKAA